MEVGDPTLRSIDPKPEELDNSSSNKSQQHKLSSKNFSLRLGLASMLQVQLIRLTRLSTLQ